MTRKTLVLSAHDQDRGNSISRLSYGITIHFYVNNNMIYDSKKNFQTKVCLGETIPHHSIKGGEMYPSSLFFTPDDYNKFYSGVVNCNTREILINIDNDYRHGITLGRVIDILSEIVEIPFDLHILTCTVSTIPNAPTPAYSNVDNRTIDGIFTNSFKNFRIGENNNDYKQKYLKYKNKYIELKNKINSNIKDNTKDTNNKFI